MAARSEDGLRRLVEAFFRAENARDWRTYARLLHPHVEWTLVDGASERVVVGRGDYLSAIRAAYSDVATAFRCVDMTIDVERARVATSLVDDAGRRSLDVFEFDGELIRREWEVLLGTEPSAMSGSLTVTGLAIADSDSAWRALTAERGAWWPELVFEPVVGAPLTETWTQDGSARTATGTVLAAETSQRLAFEWHDGAVGAPRTVTIRLAQTGPVTRIDITETGFPDTATGRRLREEHRDGWRHHLANLCRAASA
ncbi:SRPBCC family protein [Microbacterium marinilacus]|uniref:DUF4440 domain-containing protein n=1 Tax=Microbacterium marinilacus TaxID=415209 RepID=A0ABP7B2I9_9MICO|nr:SRPBCC domain-containing protein [Microbacterium marinilacus]MBY0688639.1 SRPBCC domain-containing protein [Microbacterium marinilacus]